LPAQRLTYRLVNGPTGLTVTTNGLVSWTPTEAQGPSTNRVRITVGDGVGSISQEFDILVAERNQPPVWTNPGIRRVTAGLQLTFALKATDADLPAQTLRFSLDGGPAGLSVSTNGVVSWKPTEAQGPSTNLVRVSVTDGIVPVSQEFSIVVQSAPGGGAKLTLVPVAGGGMEILYSGPLGAQYVLEQGSSTSGPWEPVPNVPRPLSVSSATNQARVALPPAATSSPIRFFRFVKP